MIGDKLIMTDRHRKIAIHIFEEIRDLPSANVIAIGGGSGTGKTEVTILVQQLLEASGKTSVKLSLDDYYYIEPLSRNTRRANKGVNSVGIKEINWDRIAFIIADFTKHLGFTQQEYNKYIGDYQVNLYGNSDLAPINFLIIEGLYANYLKVDRNYYLDANPDLTFEWRMKRGKECEVNDFRRKVVEREYSEALLTSVNADVIFNYEGEVKGVSNGK